MNLTHHWINYTRLKLNKTKTKHEMHLLSTKHNRPPADSDGEASACNPRDRVSIPALGESPEGGNGYPLGYSCLENSLDRGAWGHLESDTTEQLTHNTLDSEEYRTVWKGDRQTYRKQRREKCEICCEWTRQHVLRRTLWETACTEWRLPG